MDVLLFQTPDDGDINVENGIVELTPGFETAVYLSMFGGNEEDSGGSEDPNEWWGNLLDTDPARHYRGETETILESMAAVPANLLKVQEAAKRDLQWLLDTNAASTVEVTASMPGLNRVGLVVTVQADGTESQFEYIENWKASR